MLGRAAYHHPAMLAEVDTLLGDEGEQPDLRAAAERMIPYAEAHCAAGGKLAAVTRHMIGLFQGRPGARTWRQILTVDSAKAGAGPEVIRRALEAVGERAALDRDA